MNHAFRIIKLKDHCLDTEVHNIATVSNHVYRATLLEPYTDQLRNHIDFFWKFKGIGLSIPDTFVLRRYGVGEIGECVQPMAEAMVGPAYIYKVPFATVMPAMNVTLYQNNVIGDLFGVDDATYNNFCVRYGDYFGISGDNSIMTINESDPKWTGFFVEPTTALTTDHTPILLSNHLHDQVFMHWTAFGLYRLYLANEFLKFVPNPLFIFTYPPKPWQLEMLAFNFPELNAKYTVLDKPVVFQHLYIITFRASAFFDAKFLTTIYKSSRQENCLAGSGKLFITRDGAKQRRVINQRELNTMLVYSGFTIVSMNDFEYKAQLALIRNAKVIIFISGSDMLATLYAPVDCKIGMITNSELDRTSDGFCENFGNLRYKKFYTQFVTDEFSELHFNVNLVEFKAFISEI